jgi:deoxyribodipyrimidine photo-lyase
MSTAIALFTRDLRVADNPMLSAAVSSAERVIPLFVLDEAILASPYNRPNRAALLSDALADVDAGLRRAGARLVIRRGDTAEEVTRLVREHEAGQVFVASDVSGYAARRQRRLGARLAELGGELRTCEAALTAVEPGRITPDGRDHFAVFTPYHRRWSQVPLRRPLPAPRRIALPRITPGLLPGPAGIHPDPPAAGLTRGGERTAREHLASWLARPVEHYAERHGDLAGDDTSRLSPWLHFGCLSATELVHRAGADPGSAAFVRQVAWRDFHHQVLAARPDAARADYRPRGDAWREDPEALRAWREGHTGYPIVDAGMRQLLTEGWMHNRARLIVASFLTKTLYLDWRAGARHFLDHLADGDIANNQLNWQWVAGTGTDTRPNRVLNPLRQAERYDPTGAYVRRWVPELAGLENPREAHQPWRLGTSKLRRLGYPSPIVDLDTARNRFRAARQLTLDL